MTELSLILPAQCIAVEEFGSLRSEAGLFPDESAFVARAETKRRQEFAAGRRCARSALRLLGEPVVPLLPESGGSPRWPVGVTGSVTHCEGYVGAAVARTHHLTGLGVDAEPHSPLPEGVLDFIALPEERVSVINLSEKRPEVHWDRLLFSVKESVYKAWYPLTGAWVEFEQVRIDWEPDHGFSARVSHPAGPVVGPFHGKWRVAETVLVTTAFLPVERRTN